MSEFAMWSFLIFTFIFGTMLFYFFNKIFTVTYFGCQGILMTYFLCIIIAGGIFEMLFFDDSEEDYSDYNEDTEYTTEYEEYTGEYNYSSNDSDVINISDIYDNEFDSSSSSSELYDEHDISYNSDNVLDNNPLTTWSEGISGSGIGEYIVLTNSDKKVIFNTIEISNGNTKRESLYYLNNRVKSLKLEFDDGSTQVLELDDDVLSKQSFFIGERITSYIKIYILDIYKGSKYDDTCISDISFGLN